MVVYLTKLATNFET